MKPSKNKRRGADFERRIVKKCHEAGLSAIRAWGSDGRSLGEAPEVDLLVHGLRVQCKLRRQIAEYIKPPEGTDAAIIGDRSGQYVVITLNDWLDLMRTALEQIRTEQKNVSTNNDCR